MIRVPLSVLAVLLMSCGAGTSVPTATLPRSPEAVAPATTLPAAPASPSSSPSLTVEKLLADSYAVMQKASSVTMASAREGQPRQLSGTSVRKLGRMIEVTKQQASPDHSADSFSRVTTSFSDGTTSSTVRIGPKLWSKIDRINVSGQITSEGTWLVSEPAMFRWPSTFFGKPLDPVLESRSFDLQIESRKLEGTESKAGVIAHRLTLAGRTFDRGQASLRGAVTAVLWIDAATMRWVAEEITTKWDDTGEAYVSTTMYSDYEKDQGIKPPPGF